ncbi:TonB-linked outer membrane protein, SusC/RagA family [Reichenbachiella agariperforans]|uniref:TonB-linked outer membrane protein, SusC/RagA family n=1 Tax=Reichenbachiella agariperforans TaxID=156994 RepID=A0A1M6TNN1_REIAG|nr:TonB-dependent receptor [Reichenbachiella agariperforans]SHK58534.1 TonB-linked outer membrane protein, SusC/RagA family [Reichenbachiella agariperforans]
MKHIDKIRLYACVLVVFLLTQSVAMAQQSTVVGQVTDEFAEPIPGATIQLVGTTTGAVTDIDGRFSITYDFSATDQLVVSSLGYLSQTVSVGNQSNFQFALVEDVVSLEEIVVVGYGTQEKKDVTGSIAVVGDEDMSLRPNSQIGSLIQGKAAGVQVMSSSGKPSQGLNLRIRGTNSINAGSEPLYVVDGVPTTDTRSINPADVESISILKDASSAAIYGAQGANGVVLITTKRGTTDNAQINFNAYGGFAQVWKKMDVLGSRDYIELMQEMGQNTDWSQYTENTDWQDEVFQRGVSQNYQLSISGKDEKTNYYISGGWTDQKGAVRTSEMSRTNFKVNLDHEVSDWLKVGTRVAYTLYSDVDVTDNQAVNSGGVLLGALSTPSIIGIYNPDGSFTSNPFQNWENPLASTDGSDRKYRNQRLIGNTYAEISFLKNFKFRSNIGLDHNNDIYDYFLNPYLTSYGRALNGRAENNTNKNQYYILDNTLSYTKDIGKSRVEVLVGAVQQKFTWEYNKVVTQNFSSDGIQTPNVGSQIIEATATKSEKANQSYLSRVHYEYNDKYLLTANFRVDGSSVFGPENRWGYFPSVSGGWRISEESFLEGISTISDLKIRAGWGIVGNDQLSGDNRYSYLGLIGGGANYPIGGVTQPGTYPASISNNTLKWEESQQTNIGVDLGLWNNRVTLTADAYRKTTTDLLLNAPLPRSTGFDNAIQNIGELQNQGLEFVVSTVNLDKDFKWNTDFNISFNQNKVIDIVGQEIFDGAVAGRGEASLVREGESLGTLYGYVYGGVDPQTGDAYYINQIGESTFTPTADDRRIIGHANPDFLYGMTNTLSYKGLTLLVFLQGSYGNDILNASRIDIEGMTDPKNQSTAVLDRWRQPGDVTDIPRATWGNTDNSRISTRFIEDASYLRVKTVTLGYDLPSSLLSKANIKGLKVYVTGENLLTFTGYSGFDPEVNAFGYSNTAQGIDYGTYPQTRNFIAGLNLTF